MAVLAVKKQKSGAEPSGLAPSVRDEMNRQITRWGKAINEYGALMEAHTMTVLPDAALPLPKTDMKDAFRFAWFATPEMRGSIEAAYIHLAHFQPSIATPTRLDLPYDPCATPLEVSRQALAWSKRTAAVRSIVAGEEAVLVAELAAMKVGPPPFAEHLS